MRYLTVVAFGLVFRCPAQVFETRVDSSGYGSAVVVHPIAAEIDTTAQFDRIFGGPTEGAILSFYPNGNARRVEVVVWPDEDGWPDRVVIEWFESGMKSSERMDRGNGTTGYIKRWFENGQLRSYVELLNERIHGRAQEWSETGELLRDEVYRQSKLLRARIRGSKL
ncbi:MAG: hypothetical protein IPP83_18740 [Flavobacteriales bacterium]|nr:hypothetical protein [Flavobacteriales bacterium]MCC6939150.1 hypothetical protein [Flavobacteriales bacterium]